MELTTYMGMTERIIVLVAFAMPVTAHSKETKLPKEARNIALIVFVLNVQNLSILRDTLKQTLARKYVPLALRNHLEISNPNNLLILTAMIIHKVIAQQVLTKDLLLLRTRMGATTVTNLSTTKRKLVTTATSTAIHVKKVTEYYTILIQQNIAVEHAMMKSTVPRSLLLEISTILIASTALTARKTFQRTI
jgi:hypothetical protein